MILPLLFRAADAVLAAAQVVDKVITTVKPYLRKFQRPESSTPLPFRDVRRINDIANRAGHENVNTPPK